VSKDGPESPWVPPHDLDAEGSILSGLLNREAGIDDFQFLKAEHFYSRQNALIFAAIAAAVTAGEPWDPVTVVGSLRDQGLTGDIGAYVIETLGRGQPAVVPSTATVHAQRVFRLWQWREARTAVGKAYAALSRKPMGLSAATIVSQLEEDLRACGSRFGVLDTDARVRPENETHARARDSCRDGTSVLKVLPLPTAGPSGSRESQFQQESAQAVRTRPAARAVQALTPARPDVAPGPSPRSVPSRRGIPNGTSNRAG
jgi:hypothetical protein